MEEIEIMSPGQTQTRTARPAASRPENDRRYGAIGIPAVAAAAQMMKPPARPEPRREVPAGLRERD